MKKPIFLIILAALVAAGAWFWFKGAHDAVDTSDQTVTPVTPVEVTTLRRETIVRSLDVFGVVATAPDGEQVVTAPYECVIDAVHVAVGTRVNRGDLLLEIAPSPAARLEYESARAELELASGDLAAVQERLDLKLATNQDLLAARRAEREARLKLATFEANGLSGDGRVVATSPGIISQVDFRPGTVASLGVPLLAVHTGSGFEARLGVEVDNLSLVKPGQSVTLRAVNRRNADSLQSTVRVVGAVVDPATGAIEVRAALPGYAPWLPGESVSGSIQVETKVALVAPRAAVLPEGSGAILFTVDHGNAVRHEVKIGLAGGDLVEVIGDGLREGDPVVTLGNYELEDGMAVHVEAGAAAGSTEAAP